MTPEYYHGTAICVSSDAESYNVPEIDFMFGDVPETWTEITRVEGWFCRLTMPGYLDCTEWEGPFDTEEHAKQHMFEVLLDSDPEVSDTVSRIVEEVYNETLP